MTGGNRADQELDDLAEIPGVGRKAAAMLAAPVRRCRTRAADRRAAIIRGAVPVRI